MAEEKPLTIELIDDLDAEDIEAALDLLDTYSIEDDGVESVQDAQKLLRQHLKGQQEESGDPKDETIQVKKVLNWQLLVI